MNKIAITLSVALLSINMLGTAFAVVQDNIDTDKKYPANSWLKQSVAVVRILDKLESRVTVMKIPVGQSAQFKSLTITPQSCLIRPPSLPEDSAAFLYVKDNKIASFDFSSWILSSEPTASIFEHPLYNISMVGCTGAVDQESILSVPASTPVTSQQLKDKASDVEPSSLERSLEDSLKSQH